MKNPSLKLLPTYNGTTNNGVIIDHYEGHKRGIASNHGDPRHWFSKFGKSMDTSRQDVRSLMGGSTVTPKPTKPEGGLYGVRKSWQDKKSQIGAYKVFANAKRKADENSGYLGLAEKPATR